MFKQKIAVTLQYYREILVIAITLTTIVLLVSSHTDNIKRNTSHVIFTRPDQGLFYGFKHKYVQKKRAIIAVQLASR